MAFIITICGQDIKTEKRTIENASGILSYLQKKGYPAQTLTKKDFEFIKKGKPFILHFPNEYKLAKIEKGN